jgi:hypothetical protein
MKAFVVFVLALLAVGLVQSDRQGCYWHGFDLWVPWAQCMTQLDELQSNQRRDWLLARP